MQNENDQDLLKKLSFWEHLSPSDQKSLMDSAVSIRYAKGQLIHCGKNDCIGLLLVKEGLLRTYITSDEGREITLFRLSKGEACILSASCILKSIDFDVSIDADTNCELLQIPSSFISWLMKKNVYAELFCYKLAADRFSDVMWAMQQILFKSFDKRLADFLLEESERIHSDSLTMTHEQIAKYLGSSREVVSRMLKYFEKEGYVSLNRGTITLKNVPALKKIS